MATVLSEDNRASLRLNRDQRPTKSLTELPALSWGHTKLSRLLRMMKGYCLVKLKHGGHGVESVALTTEFLGVLNDPKDRS